MARWPTVRLGDVADMLSGYPFKSDRYTSDNSGIRLIRGDNIVQGSLRWDGVKRWPASQATAHAGYELAPDDVVLAMDRPWIEAGLKYATIRENDCPALLVQRVTRLRKTDRLDGRYLSYVIGSSAFTQHVLAVQTGTAVPHISGGQIKAFEFALPAMATQLAVASILAALDDKIELNRRMNETLEASARALFRDWFVDFGPTRAKAEGRPAWLAPDLWSLFPDRLDDDGVPDGWAMSSVVQEFNLTMGQSPPGDTYNDEAIGLPFFQGRTDFGFRYPARRKFCSAPTRLASADDTLISVRAPVGDLNMAWERCCIGRGVAAARHRTGSRSYTYYALHSIQPELEQFEHTGTVFGAINKVQFERLRIVAPHPELVAAFERQAGSLDDRVRANIAEADTLAATRDALLPKLMSGELRVRDAEALAA